MSRIDNLRRHYKTCKEKKRIEQEDKDIRKQSKEKDKIILKLTKTSSKQAGTIEKMVITFKDICDSMKETPSLKLDLDTMNTIIY